MSGLSPSTINEIFQTVEGLVHQIDQDVEKALMEIQSEVVCFAAGTMIRTAGGDVAVETLEAGDMVVTATGRHRAIKWIGHRKVDCSAHGERQWVLPVRIAKGAIAAGKPERDLVVSPGHAVCLGVVDEVLVPAHVLINGATVTQLDVAEVEYWHVELDSHDLLIADGMPAESYFDCGNRTFFVESPTVAVAALPDGAALPAGAYCRPFVESGLVVDAVRDRMRHRALALGWTQAETASAGMHLMVDGVRVDADAEGLDHRFVVPATAEEVWIVSDTYVPYHAAHQDDRRVLGVSLGRITIDDGLAPLRSIDLDDPRLGEGFHAVQDGPHRWTDGRGRLPASLWEGCRGSFFLRLDLAMASGKRWVAPVADAAVAAPKLRAVA